MKLHAPTTHGFEVKCEATVVDSVHGHSKNEQILKVPSDV